MNTRRVLHLGIHIILLTACSRNFSTSPVTSTHEPFLIQTPTATSAIRLELNACVATDEGIRIREGPGTDYETIGALASGACITILGRNVDASWVYIQTTDGFTGWVAAWLLTIEGDISQVAVQNDAGDLTAGTATTQFQTAQHCTDIANQLDSNVTCKVETAYCAYLPVADSHATFCTDQPYPNHFFQFVVYGEDWSEYNGLCLIITGSLETYFNGQAGLLQIIGQDRSQVSSCS